MSMALVIEDRFRSQNRRIRATKTHPKRPAQRHLQRHVLHHLCRENSTDNLFPRQATGTASNIHESPQEQEVEMLGHCRVAASLEYSRTASLQSVGSGIARVSWESWPSISSQDMDMRIPLYHLDTLTSCSSICPRIEKDSLLTNF